MSSPQHGHPRAPPSTPGAPASASVAARARRSLAAARAARQELSSVVDTLRHGRPPRIPTASHSKVPAAGNIPLETASHTAVGAAASDAMLPRSDAKQIAVNATEEDSVARLKRQWARSLVRRKALEKEREALIGELKATREHAAIASVARTDLAAVAQDLHDVVNALRVAEDLEDTKMLADDVDRIASTASARVEKLKRTEEAVTAATAIWQDQVCKVSSRDRDETSITRSIGDTSRANSSIQPGCRRGRLRASGHDFDDARSTQSGVSSTMCGEDVEALTQALADVAQDLEARLLSSVSTQARQSISDAKYRSPARTRGLKVLQQAKKTLSLAASVDGTSMANSVELRSRSLPPSPRVDAKMPSSAASPGSRVERSNVADCAHALFSEDGTHSCNGDVDDAREITEPSAARELCADSVDNAIKEADVANLRAENQRLRKRLDTPGDFKRPTYSQSATIRQNAELQAQLLVAKRIIGRFVQEKALYGSGARNDSVALGLARQFMTAESAIKSAAQEGDQQELFQRILEWRDNAGGSDFCDSNEVQTPCVREPQEFHQPTTRRSEGCSHAKDSSAPSTAVSTTPIAPESVRNVEMQSNATSTAAVPEAVSIHDGQVSEAQSEQDVFTQDKECTTCDAPRERQLHDQVVCCSTNEDLPHGLNVDDGKHEVAPSLIPEHDEVQEDPSVVIEQSNNSRKTDVVHTKTPRSSFATESGRASQDASQGSLVDEPEIEKTPSSDDDANPDVDLSRKDTSLVFETGTLQSSVIGSADCGEAASALEACPGREFGGDSIGIPEVATIQDRSVAVSDDHMEIDANIREDDVSLATLTSTDIRDQAGTDVAAFHDIAGVRNEHAAAEGVTTAPKDKAESAPVASDNFSPSARHDFDMNHRPRASRDGVSALSRIASAPSFPTLESSVLGHVHEVGRHHHETGRALSREGAQDENIGEVAGVFSEASLNEVCGSDADHASEVASQDNMSVQSMPVVFSALNRLSPNFLPAENSYLSRGNMYSTAVEPRRQGLLGLLG